MKSLLAFAAVLVACSTFAADGEWTPLFNGKDLTGWKANNDPDSFSVVDGTIKIKGVKAAAHLFYMGTETTDPMKFKNFELKLKARGEPDANSGVFIHTDMSVRNDKNYLKKGYEIQLNSSPKEKKKTGSLYGIQDLAESPVDETQWFELHITVVDKAIKVAINGKELVNYVEPPNPERTPDRKERLLDPNGGGIALQAHDPQSVFYFKDIEIKKLP